MDNDLTELARLDETHIELAAEQLSRAFQNYPVFVYVFPDDSERKNKLPHFFKSMVHKGLLQGEVYATSPAMEGVAVWLPPGIGGGLSKEFEVDKEAFDRFSYYGACVYGVREKYAPAEHWFLELIGVIPEDQGKGYARDLLRPMMDRADREGLPCYLDTELDKNVAIYQRYGFKVVDDNIVPETGVRSWGMLREKQ